MNENIDLTKILKDCPKGWKLYTPILGEVEFEEICDGAKEEFSIVVKAINYGLFHNFTKEGFYFTNIGECVLFPSKDQRDWSKFTAPGHKKERFDPHTLKPFDKVLGYNNDATWQVDLFSHICSYEIQCSGNAYSFCIPYNDETKHLVGTMDVAPKHYRYWEDKV